MNTEYQPTTFTKVTIQGRAGEEAVLKYTVNGKPILSFSVAVNKGPKDNRRTIWFTAKVFGELAEQTRVAKGELVTLYGSLDISAWNDKRSGERRERLEVLVDSLERPVVDTAPSQKENSFVAPRKAPPVTARDNPVGREWSEADLPF